MKVVAQTHTYLIMFEEPWPRRRRRKTFLLHKSKSPRRGEKSMGWVKEKKSYIKQQYANNKEPQWWRNRKERCAPTKGRKRLVEVKVDYLEDPTGEFWVVKEKTRI